MNNVIEEFGVDYTSVWQESCPQVAWGTVALFFGYLAGYYWTITAALDGSLSYLSAVFICAYLAYVGFTVAHDAGHGSIVSSGSSLKPMEDVLGWISSLPLLLVPYRFFQKIHDRHHAFTNDPDRDPDHFTFGEKWYQIVLNCLYIPFRYHVKAFTQLRHIKIIRDTFLSTIAYFTVVLGGIAALVMSGYGLEVLCFIVIPNMLAVIVLAMFFDYIPHHPHKSRDRYQDSRIYPGRVLNVLLLGQNYHLIHHMYPRLPWYKYREVYHRMLPHLEENDAPIENLWGGAKDGKTSEGKPEILKSPHAAGLKRAGEEINMVLEVADKERLTSDAVAITFKLPEGEHLQYKAGQYVMVSKWLDGEQHSRCYSLCSSPSKGELKIGVRHTDQGLMSGYLNETLNTGDELVVQGPLGDFVYPAEHGESTEKLVLVAGGSGITPVLSILEYALEQEDKAPEIVLIYAGRSAASLMFYEHIKQLEAKYSERLSVVYVVQDGSLHSALNGHLDQTHLESMLGENEFNVLDASTDFYICGPEGLKDMVVDTLHAMGVSQTRVHVEAFVPALTAPEGELHHIDIALADGQKHELQVASNQTVLEVANAQGVMLPHACGTGTCGTCKFKVNDGHVAEIPDTIPGLTNSERELNYTLACQCKPLGDLAISEVRS